MPISKIKGGWGEGICVNDNVYNLDPSRIKDYALNDPQSEACSIDPRYKLFNENYE